MMRADRVAERLAALLEPRMRVTAAAELLGGGVPAAVVGLVGELIARAGDSPPAHPAALDALVVALADSALLDYERRAELYAAALAAGRGDVALLLIDAAPELPGTEQLERELGAERRLVPNGRAVTLGERKSLARAHQRQVLLQLLRDPHPEVIAILLENPHVTESDVLRLASRRPMLQRALAVIGASERWRVRSSVRRALVLNPFTALPLAARLMTTLANGDLAKASVDGSLSDRLREHAAEILVHRRARPGD
jgi:hypothetical protein